MTTNERKCVCELKNACMSPVCDQAFVAWSTELNWCSHIVKNGSYCAHDPECHQPTQQQETT
jgi:hypothetical protein